MNRSLQTKAGRSRLFRAAVVMTGVAVLACSDPLSTRDPDIITPESLTGETGLATVRAGALRDFIVAYQGTGQTDGQVMLAGLMSDEWFHNGTFTTRAEIDQRQIAPDNGQIGGAYLRLHQARVSTENAVTRLGAEGADPGTDERIPEMAAMAGFTYLAFASNFCNGVPFSQLTPDELLFGDPETNVQAYDRAIAHFDAAMAHGAATSDQVNLARIGKGRALMGKGDLSGAAAAVGSVPTDFAWFTEHGEVIGGERNQIFELTKNIGRWGIPPAAEGINGLDFVGRDDPRVTFHLEPEGAFDSSFPEQWQYDNVNARSDPMRLVTGIEARLIEAENQLSGGGSAWLTTLNTLRSEWTSMGLDVIVAGDGTRTLAPLTDPGTAAAQVDMIMDERVLWLYSQNTRLFDFRRLLRQYGRNAESVYPTGAYLKAGTYRTDIQFPVPVDEANNPGAVEGSDGTLCTDRNP